MRASRILLMVLVAGVSLAADVYALTDPTRPSGFVEPAADAKSAYASLRLESVLIGESRRVAVINGKTCRVGERVEGATVVAIHSDRAVLVRNGSRITLPLLNIKVRSEK